MIITDNSLKNMINIYVDHKNILNDYILEKEDNENNSEYLFHLACCQTHEQWFKSIGISPNCNTITDLLHN